MDGLILVNKDAGMTSRDVVNKIGKIYGTKKVGHTGTLDPLATGVLAVCVGKATKIAELITAYDKEYIATFKFGVLTDTLDIEGNIISDNKIIISKEDILKACSSIIGTYMQEVPIYSAVKVNGMKLYEYARKGIDVELPKHEVTISSVDLMDIFEEEGHTIIKVKCHVSKGTYIRSLGNDIAKILGTTAIMTSLERTKQGNYNISECLKLAEITKDTKLLPIKKCLPNYFMVEISEDTKNDILDGKVLYNKYGHDEVLFIYDGEAIALYKKYDEKPAWIKPWKMFINKV